MTITSSQPNLPTMEHIRDTAAASVDIDGLIERACSRIAPTWPLDRFIAVNPFWHFVEQPFASVSAKLAALSGSRLLMPRAGYREHWRGGLLRAEHLREAIAQSGSSLTEERLLAHLQRDELPTQRCARVMDVLDMSRDLTHEMSWRDFVTHSTSQFCASYFDEGQAWFGPDREGGLYASWRRSALKDRAPRLLMGARHLAERAELLPASAREMVAVALSELGLREDAAESYLTGLLLDLNGWSAWCAYRRWNARLAGGDDGHIGELLAIRLAWEWLLLGALDSGAKAHWRQGVGEWRAIAAAAQSSQAHDWLLQKALEIAWQQQVCQRLTAGLAVPLKAGPASVQAVFCIDVRSEVFRRALEAESPRVQTLGFAGFFGMPVEYLPTAATTPRPQLPGLLAASLRITDTTDGSDLGVRRKERLDSTASWKRFMSGAFSSFTYIEALGIASAGGLLRDSFGLGMRPADPERAGLSESEHMRLKPRVRELVDGSALGTEERCKLAAGMLRAMSLTRGFARVVVLVGHGSESRNNAHAAGLDCGACCGQTGEVNARAAAALLNEPDVRSGLAALGIEIPTSTRFLAGLHNTTTDVVSLFDLDELPSSHREELSELRRWLERAGDRARFERSARLGLAGLSGGDLRAAVDRRSRDWAQVRPEWGLADNAGFIVAPRARSRNIDLAGRSFLHDYRWQDDQNFAVLELIMTAPMVVTHWINMQYYASTVDNRRYGSGNKVLHNVVGGHIGVFEGNGGDLRIGLPMQSLHDGRQWMHTPLRLSVFIEAPRDAIDAVLRKHDKVRDLVDNEWLYLFQIDSAHGVVNARRGGAWIRASTPMT